MKQIKNWGRAKMRKLRKFAKMRKCENANCENAQIFFKMLKIPNNAYIWQNSGLPYRKHVQKGQIWGKTLEFQF